MKGTSQKKINKFTLVLNAIKIEMASIIIAINVLKISNLFIVASEQASFTFIFFKSLCARTRKIEAKLDQKANKKASSFIVYFPDSSIF